MNPAFSATVSAASLALVIALTAVGESWLAPPFPNEPTRLRESQLRIDELLAEVAELQLREDLAQPGRTGPPRAVADGPAGDAALLDALEERIRRLEFRAIVRPDLVLEDELRLWEYGKRPTDFVDLLHTIELVQDSILDATRSLDDRIDAYRAIRTLPHRPAHLSPDILNTWLRDIRLADSGQRHAMVYAINGVSGNARVMTELLYLARFDDDPSVRDGAIDGLEEYLEYEQVRATLELLHRTANSLRVRNEAGRTLHGDRKDDD